MVEVGSRWSEVSIRLEMGEAFGVRLSFLALSEAVVCACARRTNHSTLKTKAAEGTAALHDAGARFHTPLKFGEAFDDAGARFAIPLHIHGSHHSPFGSKSSGICRRSILKR